MTNPRAFFPASSGITGWKIPFVLFLAWKLKFLRYSNVFFWFSSFFLRLNAYPQTVSYFAIFFSSKVQNLIYNYRVSYSKLNPMDISRLKSKKSHHSLFKRSCTSWQKFFGKWKSRCCTAEIDNLIKFWIIASMWLWLLTVWRIFFYWITIFRLFQISKIFITE